MFTDQNRLQQLTASARLRRFRHALSGDLVAEPDAFFEEKRERSMK
jgi:hypothetical protein